MQKSRCGKSNFLVQCHRANEWQDQNWTEQSGIRTTALSQNIKCLQVGPAYLLEITLWVLVKVQVLGCANTFL